jgi:hypothetical protein
VIPHSRKPQLGADAEARLSRLEKGRAIVLRACEVAGGLENWKSKRDVSFRLNDCWYLPASFWPEEKVESTHYYLLHRNSGRVDFQSSTGLHQWGLFQSKPWALLNGKIDSDGLKKAGYVIGNFDYFFELPFKFLQSGAYPEFVGEEHRDGRLLEKVYVTFGLNVGRYPTDWYLAYFDQATGRLNSMIYTSLDESPAYIEYQATFDAYRNFDGIEVPTKVAVELSRPIPSVKIHEWVVDGVRFDTGVSEAFFTMPLPTSAPATMSMN